MRRIVWLLILVLCPWTASAQSAASSGTPKAPSKVYYGGSVTFGFGDVFRLGIQPMVGYRVNPKLSVGGKVSYEYLRDSRFEETFSSSNYGFSGFGRYHFIPQVYAHAEFAGMNYEYRTLTGDSREWVPFLFLGGGYRQAISARTSAYFEVLFDVLQDDSSPYDDWEPMISVGVGVGL